MGRMKHKKLVTIYVGSDVLEVPPPELARMLGDLQYDYLAAYLSELAGKLQRDSEGDGGRGRGQLAAHLQRAVWSLDEARLEIEKAWKICEPYVVSDCAAEKKAE